MELNAYKYSFSLWLCLCFALTSLKATTYTFIGNGAWATATNWADNSVPPTTLTSGDDIIIECGTGNECQLGAPQTISAGATLTLVSGTMCLVTSTPFTLYNYGTITINSGIFLLVTAGSGNSISNFGIINLTGGLHIKNNTLDIQANTPPDQPAELNINGGGELRIEEGILRLKGKMTVIGAVVNLGGTIVGDGAWINSGNYNCGVGASIEVGETYGKLTFTNSLVQCDDDKFKFGLGGTQQGFTHDWLEVVGSFYPNNSALIVTLGNGYEPMVGQTFDIITAQNIEGTFNLNNSVLQGFSVSYLHSVVRLTYIGSLPIQLLYFDVNTEGAKNNLRWSTASEVNNKGFDIERSTDGTTFLSIGQVKGNNKASNYQYVDNTPFATTYYRLRQIDNDGKETLSKVVSVSIKSSNKLNLYPNPVTHVLTIETDKTGDFQVVNLLGQQVIHGKVTQHIDVSPLPKGAYFLKIGVEQVKFVKQ